MGREEFRQLAPLKHGFRVDEVQEAPRGVILTGADGLEDSGHFVSGGVAHGVDVDRSSVSSGSKG